MSPLMVLLAAAAVTAPTAEPLAARSEARAAALCAPQVDPQFVRFAPPAGASGGHSLLRLIADHGRTGPDTTSGTAASCRVMLTRNARRP